MIRKAQQSDIYQLAEIYRQLHKTHCKLRNGYYKMPHDEFFSEELSDLLNEEEMTLIVYEHNSVVAGYAVLFFEEKGEPINYPLRKCFIDQFAIHKDFRRRGIGTKLIEYIKKLAIENDCQSIELGVWCENYDAVEFYSNIGFVPRIYKMEMKLT